jgi:hypothetical protein
MSAGEKGPVIAAGIYMSVRCVAFGAAGRAFNGCPDGQFDECGVVVGGHLFAKSSVDARRYDSDRIVVDSEVRQGAPSEG